MRSSDNFVGTEWKICTDFGKSWRKFRKNLGGLIKDLEIFLGEMYDFGIILEKIFVLKISKYSAEIFRKF